MRSKPLNSVPAWPLHQLLPQAPTLFKFLSSLPWWWTLTWTCKPYKPFPPQVVLIMVFITSIAALTKMPSECLCTLSFELRALTSWTESSWLLLLQSRGTFHLLWSWSQCPNRAPRIHIYKGLANLPCLSSVQSSAGITSVSDPCSQIVEVPGYCQKGQPVNSICPATGFMRPVYVL